MAAPTYEYERIVLTLNGVPQTSVPIKFVDSGGQPITVTDLDGNPMIGLRTAPRGGHTPRVFGTLATVYVQQTDVLGANIGTATQIAGVALLGAGTAQSGNYAAPRGIFGGRRPVAVHPLTGSNSAFPVQTVASFDARSQHTFRAACSDVRLVFDVALVSEIDINNPVSISASIEYPVNSGALYPVTFAGKLVGTRDPGAMLMSDPVPIVAAVGATMQVRSRIAQSFGPTTTLAAATLAGATTFTINALPLVTSGFFTIGGSNLDAVEVVSITGSGPYTATLRTGTTIAHAHNSGDTVGMQLPTNAYLYADRNEGYYNGSGPDLTKGGAYSSPPGVNRAIGTGGSTAGATVVPLTNYMYSPQIILSNGLGTQETVTVRTVAYDGTTYRAYLTAPTTQSHAAGDVVIAAPAVGWTPNAFIPCAVVADVVTGTAPKAVVGLGDSIMNGYGYTIRNEESWFSLACDTAGLPYLNLSQGGESAATFVNLASSWHRRRALTAGDWVVFAYGANDLGLTATTTQTNIATILAAVKARGLKVAVCTITPRSTSTDLWATLANQTVFNTGNETNRKTLNTWIRAGAGGYADKVIDLSAVTDSGEAAGGATTGLWIADGNGPYTQDGLHPTVMGSNVMATAAAAVLATL